ncbi:hypothetical protein TD95_002967 [Thielaviopsis punctulata]|uniref:Zinc finger CHCC-type domain-containing protein n=1 Tax=Thielaviopsis punctulata TaxID=72032 RepID=A0A0F4ZKG9_9PEZI|nr:hypothetical protein TD95_002967 [Thielaviopsis punctulata]
MTPQLRVLSRSFGLASASSRRAFSMTARALSAGSDAVVTKNDSVPAVVTQQAPNRVEVWAPSQQPRHKAMTGPRFEQTDFEAQPAPYSAMALVHEQPVRWTHDKVAVCDGGVGPAGHPRIFINTDKPKICVCNYCGTPFANEHHRKHIEAQPETAYPLA